MNRLFKISAIPILIFLLTCGLFTIELNAQDEKKKTDHASEKLKADALGLAYIQCKYDVTKYNSETKKNNTQYKRDLDDINRLYRSFLVNITSKYQQNNELEETFNKEVAYYKKKLETCKKYQNILDANEKMEKMKEKNSQ